MASVAISMVIIQNLVVILLSNQHPFGQFNRIFRSGLSCPGLMRKVSWIGARLNTLHFFPRLLPIFATLVCNNTLILSIRKTKHIMGISSSLCIMMAVTAMMPPMARLPVSPMKIWAGYALYHRNPINAPTKARRNIPVPRSPV